MWHIFLCIIVFGLENHRLALVNVDVEMDPKYGNFLLFLM
jgi:hypothetical protein